MVEPKLAGIGVTFTKTNLGNNGVQILVPQRRLSLQARQAFSEILTVKVSRVISPIAYLHCKDHEYQQERLCKGWLLADEVASLGSHFNSRYLEFDIDIPTPRNVTFSSKSAE